MNVLIYMPCNTLQPTGGPRGYLYNLDHGLKTIDTQGIKVSYLPEHKKEKYKFL